MAETLQPQLLEAVTQTFKALSDPTRVRILHLLNEGECAVNDIAYELALGQSTVSHQLRLLKQQHLVKARREGTKMYYSIDDDHVTTILEQMIAHSKHNR